MNMQTKTPASPSQARTRKARRSGATLAMSTLMMSSLGVAPFTISMVKAEGKVNLGARAANSSSAKSVAESLGAVLHLRVGKSLALAFADDAKYSILEGEEFVKAEVSNGLLMLNGLQTGDAVLVMESPIQGTQRFVLKMSLTGAPTVDSKNFAVAPALSWIATADSATAISSANISREFFATGIDRRSTARIGVKARAQLTPFPLTKRTAEAEALPPILTASTGIPTIPTGGMGTLDVLAVDPPPKAPSTFLSTQPPAIVPLQDVVIETKGSVQITDMVPVAELLPESSASYSTQSPLPPNVQRAVNDPSVNRPQLSVSQGMARVLGFQQNILSVFFSDENVMDARAVNARTIAVTGKGTGRSTLAIFLAQSPDDRVGKARIYNIEVYSTGADPVVTPAAFSDADAATAAITSALGDPRVRVSVFQQPNSSLTVRLSGTLRDKAEIDAAVSTAGLFVPSVISSLYASTTAPALEDFVNGKTVSSQAVLQSNLRNIFSNDSIELVELAGTTALKVSVGSISEAESILALLPTLNRRIQPFIVIRGTSNNLPYNSDIPVLYGEDYEMTRTLRDVTGISTVYVKRTARNALALYGTVRSRADYARIRRYAIILPQLQDAATAQNTTNVISAGNPVASAAETTSISANAPALATANGIAPSKSTSALTGLIDANAPSSSYQFPTQIQMFVRMTDENASAVRLVTVDSSVVEISRTALRDLGVQLGSVSLLSETVTPATRTQTLVDGNITDVVTPGSTERTIDPNITDGSFLGGNGFIGTGGFSNINPIRARINALMQNGTAKILSKPNLTTIEGAEAQITVGGVRPIPSTSVSAGGGSSQTSVEFRRYGIILTMRPTVSDDDTILLQVRGDVTDIDFATAINLNGALIPGERVRSVDTTIAMREGDTLVMGGLITNETRKQTSKVPFLSEIPILGKLFQSKRFENNETEMAIFLTPTIRRIQGSDGFFEDFQASPGFPKLREEGRTTLDSVSTAIGN